jgi:hypothetical protein
MPIKIAFGGKMGTGKDCAVKYMINKHTGVKLSFADPIYDILHYTQQRCGLAPVKDRMFLQFVGTEWGRSIDNDIWVNLLVKATPEDKNAFVSDVRFPNEFRAMKDNGWTCVKLVRNHFKGREGTGTNTHSSETSLDSIPDEEWDYIIDNNGTIAEFYESLDTIK